MNPARRSHPASSYGTSKSSIRIRTANSTSSGFKMPRRQHLTIWMIIAVAGFLGITFMFTFGGRSDATVHTDYAAVPQEPIILGDDILKGTATAAKLENATLK